ncbi:MAG: MarR family EPS-associated transcriptional regulator [Candidatus Omnitrophota bacterium]
MNEHENNQRDPREKEDAFFLLSEIHKYPHLTQRELSLRLNVSLGKTNYLIKQLSRKGMVKVKNFSFNPGKLHKISYILTPKGAQEKIRLTYHFLKRKENEYNNLKQEWEKLKNELFIDEEGAQKSLVDEESFSLNK